MPSGVGLAMAGASLLGGIIQGEGAKEGANMQATAAKDASQLQYQQFQQQREDQQPWRQAGMNALVGLQDPNFQKDFTMDNFQEDPGYNFRLKEGMKALNNAASARGMANSGATVKALGDYNQNAASQEYSNVFNRFNANRDSRWNKLAGLAGVGQTATNQIGQAGQNYANQAGENMMGGANAQAAGRIAQGNSINNLIGNGVNYYNQNQMMNRMFPQQPTLNAPTTWATLSGASPYTT